MCHLGSVSRNECLAAMRELVDGDGLLVVTVPTVDVPEGRYLTVELCGDHRAVVTKVVDASAFDSHADTCQVGVLPVRQFAAETMISLMGDVGLDVTAMWKYRPFQFEAIVDRPVVLTAADTVFLARPR